MTAYTDLLAFARQTEALAQVAGRLGWDQETKMPRGAGAQRAEEMGAMESVLHARRTDPRLGEWLAKAQAPDAAGARMLELIRRSYERASKVPAKLAEEIASTTSLAQGIWAEARASDNVAHFAPTLRKVVALKRDEAQALAGNGDVYDALLDDYEPHTSSAEVGAMFTRMRPRLVSLRERVLDQAPAPRLTRAFAKEAQLALAREMAGTFGYDWRRGRLDLTTHPFASGSGDDVRITTRVVESDPFNCLYSTIHETGHACYEQNVDPAYRLTPLGTGVSMGVHESQSRSYENQIGRSEAFAPYLYNRMLAHFDDIGLPEAEFARAINRVAPGYIRTEADELHYNLHVMMRFDLERELMQGGFEVDHLEEAWNSRFKADFGVAVDRPSHGMLQDVHWSVGLFGYFPTYTLGNVYAGCLMAALRRDIPDLDESLRGGDVSPATGWMRDKVQQFGALYKPVDLITRACGKAPSEQPLLDYLEAKFTSLYRL